MKRWKAALSAFSVHLVFSLFVAVVASALVFLIWFPYPYYHLASGMRLFLIMMAVDIVCGPLITAIVFNPTKPRRELRIDLALVIAIQISALAYGMYSIALARPVILAFEIDRFSVVSAIEIDRNNLSQAPEEFRQLSWRGPRLVGTRSPRNSEEVLESIGLSVQGLEPSARPGWWQPYQESKGTVKQRMKKIAALHKKTSKSEQNLIEESAQKIGLSLDNIFYLPLTNRIKTDGWIVLLNADADIVGYVPIGGFD